MCPMCCRVWRPGMLGVGGSLVREREGTRQGFLAFSPALQTLHPLACVTPVEKRRIRVVECNRCAQPLQVGNAFAADTSRDSRLPFGFLWPLQVTAHVMHTCPGPRLPQDNRMRSAAAATTQEQRGKRCRTRSCNGASDSPAAVEAPAVASKTRGASRRRGACATTAAILAP